MQKPKAKRFKLFSYIFNEQGDKAPSLDSIYRPKTELVQDYIFKHDGYALLASSILILVCDIFWSILFLFGFPVPEMETTIGIIGVFLSIFSSIVILSIIETGDAINRVKARNLIIFFHLSVVASVIMMSISRANYLYANGVLSPDVGISLCTYYLLMISFVPLVRHSESLLSMLIVLLSAFVPYIVCPRGSYALNQSLVMRFGAILSYYVYRSITLRSANLITHLVDISYIDTQTETLNRQAYSEYVQKTKEKDVRNIGIMLFDLDDFKSYNSEYSHEQGDAALSRISKVINAYLQGKDALVFRYGSEEFVTIMENVSDSELLKSALKIRDIVECLRIERKNAEYRKYLTITVGCASVTKEDFLERDVLSEAESQLSIGKKGTKNCVVFKGRIYVAEGEISIETQPTPYTERVVQAITEAMRKEEIQPYYQPLYETSTHRLVGAEALSRWIKPSGEVILPAEYIPELEKNSAVIPLDWYMYEHVCRTLRKQKEMGVPQVRISVNFSRMHALYERSIEQRLSEIADSYGIPHNLIEIEITESAYIHLPNIIEPFVKNIRSEGFAVAVDDFGSGASSLGFVNSVDVDTLKIDKSLISSNCADEKERVLLESVVYLAHRLQLNSVAEGVETEEQLGFLTTLGCKQIQGYIFSMPMPEQDFIETCRKEVSCSEETGNMKNAESTITSVQMLLDTIFKNYPIVIMSNISRNSYYTMTYDSLTSHCYKQAGVLTDLQEEINEQLHPDDVATFNETYDIENQLQSFKSGHDRLEIHVRIRADEQGNYKSIKATTHFIKEKGNSDLIAISFLQELSS